jgi:glucose-1-phosphate thymidylyltransferase
LKNIKIAIPMAGLGTRMRPHTWSKPKPLISIAGKTFFDYVLGQFDSLPAEFEPEFVFIVGPNQQDQIEAHLKAQHPQKKYQFVLQSDMRGQSHAIYQAKELLEDSPMLLSFSDTLIETDLAMLSDAQLQAAAWVKPVPDPRRFGVAVVDEADRVQRLVEKPQTMENNLVLVGFYYFASGSDLLRAIEYQIENNITLKNEYFLADAVNIMLDRRINMRAERIAVWLDAGIPAAVLETNRWLLDHGSGNSPVPAGEGVAIIPPVFIHPSADIRSSVIGPHVSIAAGCRIENSILRNSILDSEVEISNVLIEDSILGRQSRVVHRMNQLNLGDNTSILY